MARARRAARRDRGRGHDARAAPHRLPRVRARPEDVAASRRAHRGARARPTSKASRATTAWSPGGDDLAPPHAAARRLRAGARRRTRSARCSTACSRAKRSASTRSSRCSARAVPRSRAVAEVADQLRREIVGDEVTFVRNRNINYTNVCTFKCRFCAFSKGPLSLNLRGDPYLLELEEMQRRVVEAVECGATEVCLQGGIHPDFDGDYYVDVARAVKEVAPADPRARVHRARGHRRRAPARHAARATTCCALKEAGLATLPGHRGRDPRRRGARGHLPRQGQHRGVARSAPHRARGRAALERHDHVRHGRAARCTSRATSCARVTLQKETGGFTEFVPLPFVHMATPIFLQGKARRGPDVPRGAARCTRSGASRTAAGSTTSRSSWVKCGVGGARQVLQAGCQRPRRHADGREHLARRGRQPRPGARRRRVPRDRRAARPPARAAHDALRPHARPSAGGCGRRPTTVDGRRPRRSCRVTIRTSSLPVA